MISPQRARFAADPRYPRRDALLDAGALAEAVGEASGVAVARVEILRAKYRFAESLRLMASVEAGGAWHRIAVRAFPPGRDLAREVARSRAGVAVWTEPLPPAFAMPGLEAVGWTFPADRKLTGLGEALAPAGLIERALGRNGLRFELAGHAPEKQVTLAVYEAGTGSAAPIAFAKIAGPAEAHATLARYRVLAGGAEDSAVRFPRLLVDPPPAGVLLFEALAGRRLAALAGSATGDADPGVVGARAFGAALARLHARRGEGLPEDDRFSPPALADAARSICLVRPDLERRLGRLVRRLESARPRGSERIVLLHGDAHPKNALVGADGRVALVDFDQCARGERAVDLAGFPAKLVEDAALGASPSATAAREGAFFDGYAGVGGLPPARVLGWHVAAALLVERARRAVERVRGSLVVLEELLAASERMLEAEAA